jgi:hypothetical protein
MEPGNEAGEPTALIAAPILGLEESIVRFFPELAGGSNAETEAPVVAAMAEDTAMPT